jgi:hypothetical protein
MIGSLANLDTTLGPGASASDALDGTDVVRGGLPQLSTVALHAEVAGSTSGVEIEIEGRLADDLDYQTVERVTLAGGEAALRQVSVAAMTDLRLRAVNQDSTESGDVRAAATGSEASP